MRNRDLSSTPAGSRSHELIHPDDLDSWTHGFSTAVAEGVESQVQRERLLAMGCTEYQGFLVSPGLPEAELLELVEQLASRAPVAVS